MKKLIILIILASLYSVSHAEMPTVIGKGIWSSETYRDNIYDWLVDHSSNSIMNPRITKLDYNVGVATETATYGILLRVHFPLSKLGDRQAMKTKIDNVKADTRTLFLRIGIYHSHNDEPAGQFQHDTISEWILK